jgi:hypothetical protein
LGTQQKIECDDVRDHQHGHIHDRDHIRRSQLPRQCWKPDLRGVVIVEDEIDQPNEIERDERTARREDVFLL